MVAFIDNRCNVEGLILKARSSARYRTEKESPDSTKLLRKVVNNAKGSISTRGGYGYVHRGKSLQNSIVKVSYATNNRLDQWLAHGKYLERQGAQREGEKGLGFNKDTDDINISKTLGFWQDAGDERIFKVIVSPEQGDRLDLKEHVRMMMNKVEQDFAVEIEWVAIDHHNTDNPHAHIAIRGVDKEGNSLTINRNYIRQGIRFRSREVATQKLGIRLRQDILKQRQKAIEQKQVTVLDREVVRMKNKKNQISFGNTQKSSYQIQKDVQVIGRLQYLSSIGFAEKIGEMTWQVKNDLIEGLQVYQLAQDIIKRKAQHLGNITDNRLPLSYTVLKEKEKLVGRIIGFGLDNEQFDKRYMLIEGIDGKVHYMKASKGIVEKRDSLKIRNGDIVLLEGKVFVKEDKKIEYLSLKNFYGLDNIKASSEINDLDKYILEFISKEPKMLERSIGRKTFQGKFVNYIKEKVNVYKRKKLLDKDFKVNKEVLNRLCIKYRGRKV